MNELIHTLQLDSRPSLEAAARPYPHSVNIPAEELVSRTHELPPREDTIQVLGEDAAAAGAVEWLRAHDRRAVQIHPGQFEQCGGSSAGCVPQTRYRLWRPSAFLEAVLSRLPRGRALDLACGTGRNAVYLASGGWDVTGVDILPDALRLAEDLEKRYCPNRGIRWCCADLESDEASFGDRFHVILCFRFLHRGLFPRIFDWLLPGGLLVFESFTTLHRARHGRPRRDSHVLSPGELTELLSGWEILEYDEGWRGEAHTARALARGARGRRTRPGPCSNGSSILSPLAPAKPELGTRRRPGRNVGPASGRSLRTQARMVQEVFSPKRQARGLPHTRQTGGLSHKTHHGRAPVLG
ncbi:MAG: methyltransferase domain-containing protein [Planctomycetes bacterium]|nr:methyltransferase domain-containing protein [Planctomycetota bacterium]